MLDHDCIFSLNFLSYKGIQTGDHRGMRYRMIRIGDKPDFHILASVWPEPFSYEVTPKQKITEKEFDFTEEGRVQAIDWMISEYENRREEWDHVPTLLNAMV